MGLISGGLWAAKPMEPLTFHLCVTPQAPQQLAVRVTVRGGQSNHVTCAHAGDDTDHALKSVEATSVRAGESTWHLSFAQPNAQDDPIILVMGNGPCDESPWTLQLVLPPAPVACRLTLDLQSGSCSPAGIHPAPWLYKLMYQDAQHRQRVAYSPTCHFRVDVASAWLTSCQK